MIEAFLLGLYVLLLSPLFVHFGFDEPHEIFFIFLAISLPGIYAMIKGAPYLPTEAKRVSDMIALAEITKKTRVVDLGCGDGRIVFAAIKAEAAYACGYELSIPVYLFAKFKSLFYKNSEIIYQDFWKQKSIDHYSECDIIFCFLMINPMKKFEKEIWPQLKTGTKVISNSFKLPNIKPAQELNGIRLYIKS